MFAVRLALKEDHPESSTALCKTVIRFKPIDKDC
jgi:hypothetical protein